MLKLQAYKPQPEEEKITRVKLEDGSGYDYGDGYGSGIVTVVAVDKDGNRVDQGILFRLLPNGTIQRMASVNPNLGFVLDDKGCIKFEDG